MTYKYVEGILEKRTPFRAEHLALANDLRAEGKILCAGALSDATGAIFIFKGTQADALAFIEADPYVLNNLVPSYDLKEWMVGIGGDVLRAKESSDN